MDGRQQTMPSGLISVTASLSATPMSFVVQHNNNNRLAISKFHQFDVYTRVDEEGKHAYIGKAVNLLRRSVSHLQGYQHIDISLKKRGFFKKKTARRWKQKEKV